MWDSENTTVNCTVHLKYLQLTDAMAKGGCCQHPIDTNCSPFTKINLYVGSRVYLDYFDAASCQYIQYIAPSVLLYLGVMPRY